MGNLLSKCKKLEKSDWGNCSVGEASPASWSDSNSRALMDEEESRETVYLGLEGLGGGG